MCAFYPNGSLVSANQNVEADFIIVLIMWVCQTNSFQSSSPVLTQTQLRFSCQRFPKTCLKIKKENWLLIGSFICLTDENRLLIGYWYSALIRWGWDCKDIMNTILILMPSQLVTDIKFWVMLVTEMNAEGWWLYDGYDFMVYPKILSLPLPNGND